MKNTWQFALLMDIMYTCKFVDVFILYVLVNRLRLPGYHSISRLRFSEVFTIACVFIIYSLRVTSFLLVAGA